MSKNREIVQFLGIPKEVIAPQLELAEKLEHDFFNSEISEKQFILEYQPMHDARRVRMIQAVLDSGGSLDDISPISTGKISVSPVFDGEFISLGKTSGDKIDVPFDNIVGYIPDYGLLVYTSNAELAVESHKGIGLKGGKGSGNHGHGGLPGVHGGSSPKKAVIKGSTFELAKNAVADIYDKSGSDEEASSAIEKFFDKEVRGHGTNKFNDLLAKKEVKEFISRHKDKEIEYSIVVRPDGKTIEHTSGGSRHVEFTDDHIDFMVPGSSLIHNHPGGGNLSLEDVSFASQYKISIISISEHFPSGRKYLAVYVPPKNSPGGEEAFLGSRYQKRINNYFISRTVVETMRKIQTGEPTRAFIRGLERLDNAWYAQQSGGEYYEIPLENIGLKGGEGSGNWGHSGLAGVHGGSSSSGGASSSYIETAKKMPWEMTRDEFESTPIYPEPDEGYQLIFHVTKSNEALDSIQKSGLLADRGQSEDGGMLWGADKPWNERPLVVFQVPKKDIGEGDWSGKGVTRHGNQYTVARNIEPKDILGVYPYSVDFNKRTDTLRSWQFDSGRGERDWWADFVEFAIEDGLSVPNRVRREYENTITTKGGKGSGNWGHQGLSGVHGGSSSTGDGGRFDVIHETGDLNIALLFASQGIRMGDKPKRADITNYAPGKGISQTGTYVASEGASSAGSFGKYRIFIKAERDQLELSPEMVQLGHDKSDIESGLKNENGAITTQDISPSQIKKIEYFDGGELVSVSRDGFLKKYNITRTDRLWTGENYREFLNKAVEQGKIILPDIDKQVTDYLGWSIQDRYIEMDDLMSISLKGGKGSGNWGHGGLPGVHGGSSPASTTPSWSEKGYAVVDSYQGAVALNPQDRDTYGISYWVLPDGKLLVSRNPVTEHTGILYNYLQDNDVAWASDEDKEEFFGNYNRYARQFGSIPFLVPPSLNKNLVRVSVKKNLIDVTTQKVDRSTLRKMQSLVEKNKIPYQSGKEIAWNTYQSWNQYTHLYTDEQSASLAGGIFNMEDLMSARGLIINRNRGYYAPLGAESFALKGISTKGGKGSGNWGHGGLPGVHGGSSPAGASGSVGRFAKPEDFEFSREAENHTPENFSDFIKNYSYPKEWDMGDEPIVNQISFIGVDGWVSTTYPHSHVVSGLRNATNGKVDSIGELLYKTGMVRLIPPITSEGGIQVSTRGITRQQANVLGRIAKNLESDARDIHYSITSFHGREVGRGYGIGNLLDELQEIRGKTEKGGPGSGHHGHAGLPGVHGGSRSTGGAGGSMPSLAFSVSRETREELDRVYDNGKPTVSGVLPVDYAGVSYVLAPDGKVIYGAKEKPSVTHTSMYAYLGASGYEKLSSDQVEMSKDRLFTAEDPEFEKIFLDKGYISVTVLRGYVGSPTGIRGIAIKTTAPINRNFIRKIIKAQENGAFPQALTKDDSVVIYRIGTAESVTFPLEDLPFVKGFRKQTAWGNVLVPVLKSISEEEDVPEESDDKPDFFDQRFKGYMKAIVTEKLIEWQEKGGKGSGNWGHGGLAGVHGGSSPRGRYGGKVLSRSQAKEELDRYISGYRIARVTGEHAHASDFITGSLENAKTGEVDAYAVYDKSNNIVAAISYRDVAEGLYVYTFGSIDRGAGILCLDHVFSLAARKNSAIIAHSAHIDRITYSLVERFGIDVSIGSQMVNVKVPAESVPEVSRLIKRFLKMGGTTKGGKGSGNWGHGGLPGVHGGSSSSRIGTTIAESNKYWAGTDADKVRQQLLEKVSYEKTRSRKEVDKITKRIFNQALAGEIVESDYNALKSYRDSLSYDRAGFEALTEILGVENKLNIKGEIWQITHPDASSHEWLRKHFSEKINETLQDFQRIVPDGITSERTSIEMHLHSGLDSASYTPREKKITFDPAIGVKGAMVHEFTHWLEDNSSGKFMLSAAKAFFLRRTQGDNMVSLKGFADAKYKIDKFLNPYIGRIYTGMQFTEVNSVGFAYLYEDPVGLAKKDPDYFNYLVNLILEKK